MLDFFRRHQRYFFVVITIVIVISFSFFGTYSSLGNNYVRDPHAFTAVDGSAIKRSQVEELATFIATDQEDKALLGGVWGPNFLNDGVIKKDFLETGLAMILAEQFMPMISQDWQVRFEKEKRYTPYKHPEAPFISVENTWNYFAPQLKDTYAKWQSLQDIQSTEAIKTRTALYLQAKALPSQILRRVLKYQEQQYSWLNPDPNLDYLDLSLFGYHTFEDWFGPRMTKLISAFIINTAKVAEAKGYSVTKAEALADLVRQATINYNQNLNNPYLGVKNANEYFSEQLRRMGMTQAQAISIWQQVLLFRRLFHDVGQSVFLDSLALNDMHDYSSQTVEGKLFNLQQPLRLSNYRALQKLEVYLDKVSASKKTDTERLMPPKTFLSVEQVAKNNPELVQKRYVLEVVKLNKDQLQSRIALKELWNWQLNEKNWDTLSKSFPELGTKNARSREDRLAALDALDERTRQRVDQFSKLAIVDQHPEWIDAYLSDTKPEVMTIGLHKKGKNAFFTGVNKPEELMKLLDQASLNGEALELARYSQDQKHFYHIRVLDRDNTEQILTFAEADKEGVLDQLVEATLEKHYAKLKESKAAVLQREDKTLKPLSEVKDAVADDYFSAVLKAIQNDYMSTQPEIAPNIFLGDFAASLRFHYYMDQARQAMMKDSQALDAYVKKPVENVQKDKLSPRTELTEQWKLESQELTLDRAHPQAEKLKLDNALTLNEGQWTPVNHVVNGDLSFFVVEKKYVKDDLIKMSDKTKMAYQLLSNGAQRHYMTKLLDSFKNKKAIALDYLDHPVEELDFEERAPRQEEDYVY